MKSIAIRLLCLQLLAALPGAVSVLAQGCGSWMTPAYSSYSSLTWSGTSINSSVLVEGTTTGTCPLGCSCSGVRHYPRANNQLGPVGGWSTGNFVPWNSYISYEDDQTVDDPVAGVNYDYESTGDVYCTVVGLFATFPFPTLNWGFAYTFTASTTLAPVGGYCPQTNACYNTKQPMCPVSAVWEGNSPNCYLYYESVPPIFYVGNTCMVPAPVMLPAGGPGECTPKVQ